VKIRETYCLHVGSMNLHCHENAHFMYGILFVYPYFNGMMLLHVLIVFGITWKLVTVIAMCMQEFVSVTICLMHL